MEAILHGTVAMANKWEFCGLRVGPLPHLPPLMTAATCCFIVTAGASSHSLVLGSAHEHQALSSPHYFDELFMVSTHEALIWDCAAQAGSGSASRYTRWWHTVTPGLPGLLAGAQGTVLHSNTTGPTTGKNARKRPRLITSFTSHHNVKITRCCHNEGFNGTCYYRKPNVLFMITTIKLKFFHFL